MSILQIQTDTAGQVNINPRLIKIVCNDTLAVVTTAGYLNGVNLQGFTIIPTDIIVVAYGATSPSNPTVGMFSPSISTGANGGVITLVNLGVNSVVSGYTDTWGGGGTTHTFAAPGVNGNQPVTASILLSTNDVAINRLVPISNSLFVSFTADPGAGTQLQYISTTTNLVG